MLIAGYAIHLATEDLLSFVTYDRRMTAIARSRGLPVASPGLKV